MNASQKHKCGNADLLNIRKPALPLTNEKRRNRPEAAFEDAFAFS
jgi:hypothetical protein